MKRYLFFFILTLSLIAVKVNGQCVSAGVDMTICQNSTTVPLAGVFGGDAAGPLWSDGGIGGVFTPNNTDLNATWKPPSGYSGIAILTLTASSGTCSPLIDTKQITVTPNASIVSVTGTTPLCDGATATYTANGVVLGGGTGAWSSSNNLVATVNSSGLVTGISAGTCNIIYTITGGCGSPISNFQSITITPLASITSVTGSSPLCDGSTTTYTANGVVTGGGSGAWSSSNPLVATVNSSGLVTGISAGTCNITYTITGGCGGTVSGFRTITINPLASISSVTGTTPICVGATTTYTANDVVLGGGTGAWSSSNPLAATVNSSGLVTGVAAGTAYIRYTITGGCGGTLTAQSTQLTVSAIPGTPVVSITQPTCTVTTGRVNLSGLPSTGTWTLTRDPGNVTTTGTGTTTIVTGLSPGTYTFRVANAAGCTSASTGDVVILSPPASPATPVQTVDCTLGFGNARVTVTSPIGAGLEYNIDGGVWQTATLFSGVDNGNHLIAVRNTAGCTTLGVSFPVSCGCINPPVVTLSSISSSICGTTPVTVSGNTFGGTATSVTITENGAGSVSPVSSSVSPFSFTYTPTVADGGRTVIITVTTNNPLGAPCAVATATYTLTVDATPVAPIAGTVTHPTCAVATGSVILSGLPSPGTWTLTRSPDAVVTNGTGTSTTVSGLIPGTYTFTVASAAGCISPPSLNITINPQLLSPQSPVIGAITQPTCAISTGSVELSGLPATGSWTVTRTPGGVTRTGSGTAVAITTIPSGTYTFTVTNSSGCISAPSANVVINPQPSMPSAPSVGTISPPTCTLPTGSVILNGLPATGTWTLTRYPGTVITTGTGNVATIEDLPAGTYNFTVTNESGCLSVPSANAVIPVQPPSPNAPVVGTITQPTISVPTGSVVLNGLPSSGAWILTRLPDEATTAGTGSAITIANLPAGVFTFTIRNTSGCTSPESAGVIISTPGVPVLVITDPAPLCSPATADLTESEITAGSTPGLAYSYWTDEAATITYSNPLKATNGTYYIKGTTVTGYFNIKPVVVSIYPRPIPNAGADQILEYQFNTILEAELIEHETGVWSVVSGTAEILDSIAPNSEVTALSIGDNILQWKVTNEVCPSDSIQLTITVHDLRIPTLITPNGDSMNEYLELTGLESLGKTELIIFDRRGTQVFKNDDYDNLWNGVDLNEKPLPDDTYFFIIKTGDERSISGYVVIRR